MSSFNDYYQKTIVLSEAAIERKLRFACGSAAVDLADFAADLAYMTLKGGKRIRYLLVRAVADMYQLNEAIVEIPAVATELVHAYSLVHDDLPAMDDDKTRRGKLCLHLKSGEAAAILTGDALHSMAFEIIADLSNNLTDRQSRVLQYELARAVGFNGMAGGQYLDLHQPYNKPTAQSIIKIHRLKTAALFRFACMSPLWLLDNPPAYHCQAIEKYASAIGLLFQAVDDLLDCQNIESNEVAETVDYHAKHAHEALQILDKPAEMLHKITDFLQSRKH